MIAQEDAIIVAKERALRRITLNRPKALNALTLEMAQKMTVLLRSWAADAEVAAVLIDGAGERGLCAGGDIRALYDAARAGDFSFPARFWSTEYRLDVLIARHPKPVVVVMDGVVMGGGVGLSAHAAHRVVTERSAVAMPEVGIGYFPDVGVSFLLARSPGNLGTYLVLTGERMNAADAIYCGVADIHIPAARLAELPAALANCRGADEVWGALKMMAVSSAPARLAAARAWIDNCFSAENVEAMIARLRACDNDAARAALASMEKVSPTGLKIALRNIRSAAAFKRLEESFQQDYRISLACIAGHDFIEGIRAAIVDKDRNPRWRPERLEDVTEEMVSRYFRAIGELELKLSDAEEKSNSAA